MRSGVCPDGHRPLSDVIGRSRCPDERETPITTDDGVTHELWRLDSPAAVGSADHEVAHVALDGVEFCRLAAGHVPPAEAAAGQRGDREAIRDVLYAAASLSRM